MRRTFRVPLYEMKLVVVVVPADDGPNISNANAAARANRVPLPFPARKDGKAIGVVACAWDDFATGRVYVMVAHNAPVGIICHEAAHAADYVVSLTGLPRRGAGANEQYTYLVGWIAQRVYDTVRGRWSAADAAAQRSAARL